MGGGASTDTFLGGRQAATLLTTLSWWLGGIFLVLSLVLAGLSSRGAQPRSVLEGQLQAPAPVNVQPLPLDVEPAPSTPQPTPPPENQ
jgi:preprotein translocase subunit SecG